MGQSLSPAAARAALEWMLELGADEAIGDAPVNRYDLGAAPAPNPTSATGPATLRAPVSPGAAHRDERAPPPPAGGRDGAADDPVALARDAAASAADLSALAAAMATFEGCELKRGAKNLVFADGLPGARVMVIGEAPGREEDLQGKPFVGPAGQLLDAMFAAIGLARGARARAQGLYITNVLPWRPPQNRDPRPEEVAMLLPFLERHVALAAPDMLVLMGNHACAALLGRGGITRLRGQWAEALGRPALPMFHPAYLLRNPVAKRAAWHDLLLLQHKLREAP